MMEELKYPSLPEIRAQHAPKVEYERYLFASRYVFRPPSFPAIWLLVRLGLTSEGASWLSGAAALSAFICLLWPGAPLLWPGILLLILFNFIDCLDGGIARAMKTRNPYGRFLDTIMGWADMAFWCVIGTVVWRMPEMRSASAFFGLSPEVWLVCGTLSAFFALYAVYLENTFDQLLRPYWETLIKNGGVMPTATPIEGKPGFEVFFRVLFHNLRVRESQYLLLALACAFGAADVLAGFFLVVNAAHVLVLLAAYCRRGRKIYDSGLGR